jgi:serine/threonine-protein kinase
MNTDRNLLFGILAVQTELIDVGQFVEVCADWIVHKQTPLAELLIERGWITGADRADVERLLQRKLQKHGEDIPSTLAPVLDADLRASLAALDDPDIWKTIGSLGSTDGRMAPSIPPVPLTRERYSLLRVHATGGIGRVWLARDDHIGRDVALKELRPEHAGQPAHWMRFLREAQITGQLEHPGIVPVYELARRPGNQQPFYTMRFVQGRTLSAAARQYREQRALGAAGALELRGLINAFVAVCNAVGYAHVRGVVHRDLKGDNVILGDFGEVIVLDWGLAKVLGRLEETGVPVSVADTDGTGADTLQGEIMGTPAFMAPEQAAGQLDRIDQRSDVYGLGAILYEVLTGQAPFSGGSAYEVLQTVREKEPDRPRRVCPDLPPALEAICLRALAKIPEDRYCSARALAQDVQRWLADEPVEAYREPPAARLARWGRRHKTAVAAAAALLITAVAALSCSTALIAHEQKLTEEARLREREQREQAQQSLEMACRAVDEMLTEVGQNRLAELPGMDGVRRELLRKALRFYQQFLADRSEDPRLRLETGRAHRRLAAIYQMLGEPQKGLEASAASLAILNPLAIDFPARTDYQFEVARGHQIQGRLLDDVGRYADELAEQREVRRIFAQLFEQNPDVAAYAEAVGDSDTNLGFALSVMERRAEAADAYRQALRTYRELAGRYPSNPAYLRAQARIQNNLGLLLASTGEYKDAAAVYHEGITNLKRLVAQPPAKSDYLLELSIMHNNLGRSLAATGQLPDAQTAYDDAVKSLTRLVNDFPTRPDYRMELANSFSNLVPVLDGLKQPEQAEKVCRQAQELLTRLANDFPALPAYRHGLACAYTNLGVLLRNAKKYEEAETAYREAVKIFSSLAEIPDRPSFRRTWAASLTKLAQLLRFRGRTSDAAQNARQVVQICERLAQEFGTNPDYQSELGKSMQDLAILLGDQGQLAEARRLLEQAVEHQQAALRLKRDCQDYREALGDHYGCLAEACLRSGDTVAGARSALEMGRTLPEDSHGAARLLARCAAAVGKDVGMSQEKRTELAQAYASQAIALLRQAVQKGLNDPGEIEQNKDLEVLRDRQDYRSLIADMQAKKRSGSK